MIGIYLRNGKYFKLIESFIAEEDEELYHSLIDQDGVTMLLQDTVLKSLKYGDVFLNSKILDIEKGLTVKQWIEEKYEPSKTVRKNIYDLKHKYDDEGGTYMPKDLFTVELNKAGYIVDENDVYLKDKKGGKKWQK